MISVCLRELQASSSADGYDDRSFTQTQTLFCPQVRLFTQSAKRCYHWETNHWDEIFQWDFCLQIFTGNLGWLCEQRQFNNLRSVFTLSNSSKASLNSALSSSSRLLVISSPDQLVLPILTGKCHGLAKHVVLPSSGQARLDPRPLGTCSSPKRDRPSCRPTPCPQIMWHRWSAPPVASIVSIVPF